MGNARREEKRGIREIERGGEREKRVDRDECTRRASLHLRSLPNGVESFHGEGTSSSFTDREPLHLPLHSFFASREIFSLPGEADHFVSTMENFITCSLLVEIV